MLNDLSDFIAANTGHLGLVAGFAFAVAIPVWGVSLYLQKRTSDLQAQEVKNAKALTDVYKAQLDGAKERLKELAPQSQATDLAGLVDDLERRFTTTAKAAEPLPPNRLVHVSRNAQDLMVVRLADRASALGAHGYVAEAFDRGADVQVQRQGQFKLSFSPAGLNIFLGDRGEPTESHDPPPEGVVQTVGTLGPGGVCLFNIGMTIRV